MPAREIMCFVQDDVTNLRFDILGRSRLSFLAKQAIWCFAYVSKDPDSSLRPE